VFYNLQANLKLCLFFFVFNWLLYVIIDLQITIYVVFLSYFYPASPTISFLSPFSTRIFMFMTYSSYSSTSHVYDTYSVRTHRVSSADVYRYSRRFKQPIHALRTIRENLHAKTKYPPRSFHTLKSSSRLRSIYRGSLLAKIAQELHLASTIMSKIQKY